MIERRISMKRMLQIGFIILLISLVLGGCSTTVKERQREPAGEGTESRAKYYHFDDVLIPHELNFKQKKSFVYETPRFKAGILYFKKWRLDVESLIDFFNYHMEKDNWKLVNSFKGKENILNFSKPDKNCTIKISENWMGYTEVEVRVGPTGEKKM